MEYINDVNSMDNVDAVEAELQGFPDGYDDNAQYPTDEELLEDSPDMMGYSEQQPLGGIYKLFDTVLNKPRSTKVSNVNKIELGDIGITVRDAMEIANVAKQFKHPTFSNFFLDQAGIITDSAMSKEGWFTELFVTTKKYGQRVSSASVNNLPQYNKKGKWNKLYNKEGQQEQE